MTPIRVAYDCHVFTWQQYGGISRYFVELARRVAVHERFRAEVVAPVHVSHYLRDAGIAVRGIYAPLLPETFGRATRAANRLGSVAYLWMRAPRILHETYYGNWTYRPPKAAVVITVHDMINERLAHLYPGDHQTAARKARAVGRADLILCVSEHARRDLMEIHNVPAERTRVVPPGAGIPHRGNELRSAPPLPGPFLLFVGDRGFQKNFARLVEAYAASARLQRDFALVAFGRQPFWGHELAQIRKLGVAEGRVLYRTGNDDALAHYYSHAAALVYPSLYEGFGLPLLEAMSFDCPVICSNATALPETAGDAALLVDPTDTGGMRDAIERVVYSQELRRDLVTRGRDRITRFTWERCAAETMAAYLELT